MVLMWENLGPTHHDRLRALQAAGNRIVALQLFDTSATYDWETAEHAGYAVRTLCPGSKASQFRIFANLVGHARKTGSRTAFFCHYDMLSVFLASLTLRLLGWKVLTMIDSKFDDYPRKWYRELGKVILLAPYSGAIVGSPRSVDYLRFLGFGRRPVLVGYDTLDIARLSRQGAPETAVPFAERPFLIVARHVAKKNLSAAIDAYARFCLDTDSTRKLILIGDGPLRGELERQVQTLGIANRVEFQGWVGTVEVTQAMRRAVALVLPSIEEQYGLVTIEALANGLPVIVSRNAGATDVVIDNLVNGFVISPGNEAELVAALTAISADQACYEQMSRAALASATRGDVVHFVSGVRQLCSL